MTAYPKYRPGGLARHAEAGATLVEVLVVLVIIGILAVTALPMLETTLQRRQETELHETLRIVRTAIDTFHADWQADRFEPGANGVSDNGYPETLDILVAGMTIRRADGEEQLRRYLRRLPENPFHDGAAVAGWLLIGYDQTGVPSPWNRVDVYDLRPRTGKEALDGRAIGDW